MESVQEIEKEFAPIPIQPGITQWAMGGGRPIPPIPGEMEKDYIVEFNGPDDPTHPYNWSPWRKVVACFALGFTTMSVSWGSAIYATANKEICEEFGVGEVVGTLGISLYMIGFAGGPVVWGSCSEIWGRKYPTLLSQFLFVCFTFAAAVSKDLQTLMISRFFQGFLGSAPLAVVGGAFADMYDNRNRGKALVGFLSTVFFGPTLAPIAGGYITSSYLGWRWTNYITGIMGALALVMCSILYPESYYPSILAQKAQLLRQETANWAIHASGENDHLNLSHVVHNTVLRPLRMLVTQPVVACISIYMAFAYGILYLCLEVFPIVYVEGYAMDIANANLTYIGVLIGMLFAGVYMILLEPIYLRKIEGNGNKPAPNARLDALMVPSIMFPIGLFLLFWSGNYPNHIHWIVPTTGAAIVGFALMGIFLSAQNYAVESYLQVSASVLAACAFMRASFAAAFPLFAQQMFHNMGVQWAGTLLGCIALLMVPIPFLFKYYADRLAKTIKQY